MVMDMKDFDLTLSEQRLFSRNVNRMLDMDKCELVNLLKYIMCKYTESLYAINNLDLGYDERKLYCDIKEVFKNEDYMDMLDYIVRKDYASIELYDLGWCGIDTFYKKIDNYVWKFKKLGYDVKSIKHIFDECDGAYANIDFKFQVIVVSIKSVYLNRNRLEELKSNLFSIDNDLYNTLNNYLECNINDDLGEYLFNIFNGYELYTLEIVDKHYRLFNDVDTIYKAI